LDPLAGKHGMHAILQRGAQVRQPDVVAEKFAQVSQLARCDVGLREQIGAQQVRERARVDGVRLHARRRDRLRLTRMSKVELDPLRLQEICQPLPPVSSLERNPSLSAQLGEDRAKRLRVIHHPS